MRDCVYVKPAEVLEGATGMTVAEYRVQSFHLDNSIARSQQRETKKRIKKNLLVCAQRSWSER